MAQIIFSLGQHDTRGINAEKDDGQNGRLRSQI